MLYKNYKRLLNEVKLTMTCWFQEFENPGIKYRPLPFWSWNDKLNPRVLRWQIQEMQKVGLGGYFMHARGGLETKYLQDDWFSCISNCIDEGKKVGLNSWVYDESGWPSGFAGGLVTAHGDKYYGRWLTLEDYSKDCVKDSSNKQPDNVLAIYAISAKGESKRISYDQAEAYKEAGERVVIIKHHANRDYIDVMNGKAVDLFIHYTHEKYFALFESEFGKGLKGFFTDEPRFSGSIEGDIPWSYVLPGEFQKRYQQDLISLLPSLFLPCEAYAEVRYQFWQMVNDLFVTNFIKRINDWCKEHNCKLTGHIMMEESIFSQMTSTGGVMPFYEYMEIPGIDWLRRRISNPIVPKQVSSVASQLGRPFVLTESYALSGWDVSFEDLKWIAEWQYVNGVNLMCQHLQGYTIRGLRKRDYPPSLFIQQSWWNEYKIFNDYLARLGVVLSHGKQAVDVLVIHPMQSGWVAYDGTKNQIVQKLDEDFAKLSEMLSGLHVDYHYGDETLMKHHAKVEGNKLYVGKMLYKVVVLPSMLNISDNTVKILHKFIDSGGVVISTGTFPKWCAGKNSKDLVELKARVQSSCPDLKSLKSLLSELHVSSISIEETSSRGSQVADIHYQERVIDGEHVYFLVNHSEDTYQTIVTLPHAGHVKQLIVEDGQLMDIDYTCVGNTTQIKLEFLPRQSYLIMLTPANEREVILPRPDYQELKLADEWTVSEMDFNSLTLDKCSYRIDGGNWEEPLPVIKLMNKLLKLKRPCEVEMKFQVQIDIDPPSISHLYLVVEDADQFEIMINNQMVTYKDIGWWKDTSFKKIDIKEFVERGNNEIILKRQFYQSPDVYHVLFDDDVYETEKNQLTYSTELESIYLIGDFGVVTYSPFEYPDKHYSLTNEPFVIVEKPRTVKTGDLTYQGLLFFCGVITLEQKFLFQGDKNKRILLKMKKPNAPMAKLFVNNKLVRILLWVPYDIDVTDYLIEGENQISIQLFASNRNLLGPHHHIAGEPYSVGPSSFVGEWSWVEKEGETQVTSDEERQKDFWRDGYAFVRFGLNK